MSDKQINNHTPLPWNLRKMCMRPSFIEAPKHNGMAYGLDVCGDDYSGYGDDEQREQNMEFMHHACNNFYPLLAALKAAQGNGKDDDPEVWRQIDEAIQNAETINRSNDSEKN